MSKEYKCDKCNKSFTHASKLDAHLNRKKPCILPITSEAEYNNPNRCTFCNKIFSDRAHLLRHQKLCKIKTAREAEAKKKSDEMDILREMFIKMIQSQEKLIEKVGDIENTINTSATPNTINNNVNNNITNTVNNNLNITLNNYATPTVPNISFEEIKDCHGLHRLLLQKIYFNSELPENHVVFPLNDGRRNPRDRCLGVYDNNAWKKLIGDLIPDTLSNVSEVAFKTGVKILRDNEQSFRDEYNAAGRPVEFKTRIANFKAREEMATYQEIFEMAVEFSPLVKRPSI